jgi:hypothetical protein
MYGVKIFEKTVSKKKRKEITLHEEIEATIKKSKCVMSLLARRTCVRLHGLSELMGAVHTV